MMTTERNVSEIFQYMAEDVNGEPCVPYDRFDWPYVVFEANIADPYSLNHDYKITIHFRIARDTQSRICSDSQDVAAVQHEYERIDKYCAKALVLLPGTRGKFMCMNCRSSAGIIGAVTAPMIHRNPNFPHDESLRAGLIHSMVTGPYCSKPECKDKVAQKAYSNLLEGGIGKMMPSKEAKRMIKNMRKSFVATCNKCGKVETFLQTQDQTTTTAKFKSCSKCMGTFYCSKECQVSDWKVHKRTCTEFCGVELASQSENIRDSYGEMMKFDFVEKR